MTRKALGRGLGALLSADQTFQGQGSQEIPVDFIDPSGMQPRTRFDETKLDELAQSIRANGVVQPVLVRRKGERYELIAGERRWRAAQRAGLAEVPALVRDIPDEKVLEFALIENIQREDLNAIEEARAYRKLLDKVGLTQESLAEQVGRDRSYITNYLRLLRLPADIQSLVEDEKLTAGHARAIVSIPDADAQRRAARRIIQEGLSVRATERLIQGLTRAPATRKLTQAKMTPNDPNVRAAETRLRRHLGTQVRIVQDPNGRGRVELEFYSSSDLDRLFQLLMPSARAAH
jgi:ParB family transcriptional regulator, chromosome partitioning protein